MGVASNPCMQDLTLLELFVSISHKAAIMMKNSLLAVEDKYIKCLSRHNQQP